MGYFGQLAACKGDQPGDEAQPPKPLPWYPNNLGWQLVVGGS